MNEYRLLPTIFGELIQQFTTSLPLPDNTILIPGEKIDVYSISIPGRIRNKRAIIKLIRQNTLSDFYFNPEEDEISLLKILPGKVVYFVANKKLLYYWMVLLQGLPGKKNLMPDWMLLPVPEDKNTTIAAHLSQTRVIFRKNLYAGGTFEGVKPYAENLHYIKQMDFLKKNSSRFKKGWICASMMTHRGMLDAINRAIFNDEMIFTNRLFILLQLFFLGALMLLHYFPKSTSNPFPDEQFGTEYNVLISLSDRIPMILHEINYHDKKMEVKYESSIGCEESIHEANRFSTVAYIQPTHHDGYLCDIVIIKR